MTILHLTPDDLVRDGRRGRALGTQLDVGKAHRPTVDAGAATPAVTAGLEKLYNAAWFYGAYVVGNGNKLIAVGDDALIVDGNITDDLTCLQRKSWAFLG